MLKKKRKLQAVMIELEREFVRDMDARRKRLGYTRKAYIKACIDEVQAAQDALKNTAQDEPK